jgi:hypothetical protein
LQGCDDLSDGDNMQYILLFGVASISVDIQIVEKEARPLHISDGVPRDGRWCRG